MADINPQQVQELLEAVERIAASLQTIATALGSAHLNNLNHHLSQIAQKTGRG